MRARTPLQSASLRPALRGSVYILVLATATLLAVGGLSVIMLARLQIQRDAQRRDLERAGVIAESAIQAALGFVNSTSDWRTLLTKATDPAVIELDQGTATWYIQETDGSSFAGGTPAQVRLVGVGTCGQARRVYTVTASPPASGAYDALRCAVHSGGDLFVNGPANINGVVSSNSHLYNEGTMAGNIEALEFTDHGIHSGKVVAPAQYKFMPDFNTSMLSRGITISYGALPSGKISKALLSPTVNTLGLPSLLGVYSITVPAGKRLTISDSRILGTLVVDLVGNAELVVNGAVCWQPSDPSLPTLLVRGGTGSSVLLASDCDTTLYESSLSTNFNPLTVPYSGSVDTDTSDRYPSEITGLIDIAGSATLRIQNGQRVFGCILVRGSVKIDEAYLQADPSLLRYPPTGYTGIPDTLSIDRGTWNIASFDDVLPRK